MTSAPLPADVRKLGWISFFTDFASEMVYPVIPLFLTATLGAPVAVLGAIEGVAEAAVSVMKAASGWHSDRMGKRVPYIRTGYGVSALSKPLLALAFSWPVVFAARALDKLGKGLRTTSRDAMIVDAVPATMTGRAFGFHRMMDTAGALAGVLFALLLLQFLPGNYRTVFLIAALPGVAAVALTFRLRDAHTPDSPQPAPPRAKACASDQRLPASYWWTLGVLSLFALANSSDALLLLRAKNLGWTDAQVITGYMLFNLSYAASSYPLGMLSDRLGRWRLLIAGWGAYSAVYFGFATLGGQGLWWLFPVYGISMGLTEGVGRALIADHIPAGRKGMAFGVFHMSLGLAALISSTVAGLLWDRVSPGAPFVFGGCVGLLAVVAALLTRRRCRLATG